MTLPLCGSARCLPLALECTGGLDPEQEADLSEAFQI
jgi:hypothetical protein